MSMWGPAPAIYRWTPPTPPAKKRWTPIVAVVLVLALGAGGGALWFDARSDDENYPSEWDPRVEDLVAFVEDERGLRFDHPVTIEFFGDAAWEREMTSDDADLTDEERQDLDDGVQLLRAVGLVEGDVDLLAETNEFSYSSVLALYDFHDKQIRVHSAPSAELAVDVRGTLVHELTHVLQDQHFDLTARYDDVGDDSLSLDSLVEGDATNVENAWVERLSKAERKEYDRAYDAHVDDAESVDVPPFLETLFGAPYAFGPPFAMLLDSMSRAELNEAFEDPPLADEHSFSPASYIANDVPELVATPKAPGGARAIGEGNFGATAWFVLLSERIDAQVAFRAVQGWGGDQYVDYSENDRACTRIRYRGESPEDTTAMRLAIMEWIESLPTPFASVEDVDDDLLFESCDPGADADLTTGKSADALVLPVSHSYILATLVFEGFDIDAAECVATTTIAASTVEELMADGPSDEFSTRIAKAVASCE